MILNPQEFLDKKIIRIKTKQAYLQKLDINSPKEILDKILPPLIVEGKVFNFDNIIKNKKILTQFLSNLISYFKKMLKNTKQNKVIAPKNKRNKYGFPEL